MIITHINATLSAISLTTFSSGFVAILMILDVTIGRIHTGECLMKKNSTEKNNEA